MRGLLFVILVACSQPVLAEHREAIFAGGCFWCVQADFDKVDGVIKTIVGYDGGTSKSPNYSKVSSGRTNYAEAVKIVYDPQKVNYSQLLDYYWKTIDPTVKDKQFCDVGKQYRSAIFYLNAQQKTQALQSKTKLSEKFSQIATLIQPSTHFYAAEEYHQNYYKKHPIKYKYYRYRCGRDSRLKALWKKQNSYQNFNKNKRLSELTPLQYAVTQKDDTERPFNNRYWNNKQAGIYVDIVSGEPLFSSTNKYDSKTGWPSFTKPINTEFIVFKEDRGLLWQKRIEVRSKYGDSHLGHVFEDGPKPLGKRYCINSAALKFIKKEDMQKTGYGAYLYLFKD